MNGRISKRIRKMVYGDYATNSASRRYKLFNIWKRKKKEGNRIESDELRRTYQATKKAYIRGKIAL